MESKRRRNRRSRWWLVPATLLVAAAAIVTAVLLGHLRPSQEEAPAAPEQRVARPVGVTSDVLFFGNAFWGRYINDWSMASELKTAYPFSRLDEFGRENYDAWIAGLECPTVAGFHQTSAQEDATLSFNCSPDYLPEAAKWFTAFTMANNHTDNRGAEGFAETRQHLEENGIQYFGHYDPTLKDEACEVLGIPVKVAYDDGSTKEQMLPMALCAYHGVFQIPPEDSIAMIEQYSDLMPVIAMPHMGVEYQPAPDQLKTSVYRSMIDHGADMVLGDHPHWIQNSEAYKGHLIVYSMGNFMFDQQDTPEVVRSAGIHVKFSVKDADQTSLEKWLAIGESCTTFHDDCLTRINEQKLSKLPFTYQFGVVGTDDSGKITKPATPAQQASILQRLDWPRTISGLQAPYASL